MSMPLTAARTYAGSDGEYRFVAVAWRRPTAEPEWTVEIDAGAWMHDGTARNLPGADGLLHLVFHGESPTGEELVEDIRRSIGPTRLETLVDITAPAREVEDLLGPHLSRFAVLLEDMAIAEVDTARLASRVASVLSFGDGGETPAILAGRIAATLTLGDDGRRVGFAQTLIAVARGAHLEPPVEWWREPLGRLIHGIVGSYRAGSDVMAATEAAAELDLSVDEVVRLVNEGEIERHPRAGVSRASVSAFALREAQQRT